MIDKSSIETLKQTLDIVDVIGNYIELKKAGANYKANCPFHGEKTPSFVVSPSKQIYHCFGCGVGGDAIGFVMEKEKLSYPEAIEKLASMYNVPLRYTGDTGGYNRSKQILENIQGWYRSNLDSRKDAVDYLSKRGVSLSSIEEFGIGYAPSSSETITFLKAGHIPLPSAIEAGILAVGERGEPYARLIDRVTFPIHSPAGAIVGFGGRTLGNHPAKYINSPQTALFNKSSLLYGYHLARDSIFSHREIVVCEGYLDVVMLHQAGFKNAVATLGTALTEGHLPLLRKGDPQVVLAYDGDSAGVSAALKASILLSGHGFFGRVVLFPEGVDPADMVAMGRSAELSVLLRGGERLVDFVLQRSVAMTDMEDPASRERLFSRLVSYISSLPPLMGNDAREYAATLLGVSPSLLGRGGRDTDISPARRDFGRKEDPVWQSILKTLLENERLVSEAVDIFSPEMAGSYREAYEAVVRGDTTHPELLAVAVSDDIPVLDEEEFRKTALVQLESFYMKKLRRVSARRDIPYDKKSYLIRKIKMDILPRLKKGELVPYESDISI